jgi:hypothetical protein
VVVVFFSLITALEALSLVFSLVLLVICKAFLNAGCHNLYLSDITNLFCLSSGTSASHRMEGEQKRFL